jgi:lysophospholipase L1-like esterase
MTAPITRRTMLASAAAAASTAALGGCKTAMSGTNADAEASCPAEPAIKLEQGATILLQGDSITDARRSRKTQDTANDFAMLGNGYAKLIAYHLLTRHADKQLKIFNRGVSGHKVPQLDARWGKDTLDLKPDVLSILIGVNDIWHSKRGGYDGTLASYADGYKALLERTRDALPDVQLVICEPFVTRTGAVKDSWFPDFDGYRAAARSAADQFGAVFVPFHAMFAKLVDLSGDPAFWAGDGVHPSAQGQAMMAARWLGETGLA